MDAKYTDAQNLHFQHEAQHLYHLNAALGSRAAVESGQTSYPTVFGVSRCFAACYRRWDPQRGKKKPVFGWNNVRESPLNKQEHAVKANNHSRGERDCFQGECVLPE